MKYTKKALALFLALCMMITSVPLSANATEAETLNSEVIDAALFFSDLHTSQFDYKTEEIKAVMGGVKSSGLNFSTVTSVGDAFSSNEYEYSGNTSRITQSIKDGLGDSDLSVYYAWSDHDRGANIENYTGLLYGDENTEYYIYTISMSDMSSEERYGVASTFSEEKLTSFSKTIDNLDHNKPLFIVSHQPLHARRGDNQYAEQWYNVISEAAEKMDIAFFWGHNHTSETSVDRDAYYVAKDGSETMQIEGMNNSIVPNFTYLNAGYMNESQYNSSSTREYVATAVTIYDEKINYTLYDEDGVYSGNYSLNEDVVREFAETSESMEEYTLSSIEVTNIQKTNYLINQELDMTDVKVTATYTKDGSSDITKEIKFFDGVNVTDGYTLSGYDKTKVGKQTITVSYNDVYTTFEIQVFERIITAADNMVNIEVTTPGVTSVEVNIVEPEMISAAVKNFLDNYVAYDIKPIGYNDGEKVTVTLPVPDNVTNPVVYYVSDDGNIIKNMNAVKTENGSTVSFETEHFSVYVVGEGTFTEALENEITTGGTSYEEKTVYVKVDSIENGEKYLLIGEDGPTNGSPIALVNSNGSDTTSQVTVRSNSTTADGVTYSDGYIELNDSNAVFTASGDANSGYIFQNGNYYIGGTDATTLHKSSNSAVKVTYDAEQNRLRTASGTTRYLYYSTYGSETWKWALSFDSSSSSRAMYIYKEVTAQIPTSSQVVYKMHASDLEHVIGTNNDRKKLDYTLLINGKNATSETLPAEGSYRFTPINSTDDNAIITSISADGVIDFNGKEGKQYVKVEYNWSDSNESYSVYKYVVVSAVNPYYTIEITDDTTDTIVNNTIVIKNVKLNQSYDLGIKLLLNGLEDVTESLESSKITWISSDENIAKIDSDGIVIFPGAEGTVHITVVYELEEGKSITDSIVMSVSQNAYIVPEDGTDDFPEYPNEGAIRYDKTATAVGNFSETGIAQLELSMTGVPFTTGNELDVVLMLDRSSSMTDTRIAATKAATKVFIKNIVQNEDGTFNGNRIYVGDFLGGNPEYANNPLHNFKITPMTTKEEDGYQIVNNIDELNALFDKIDRTFVRQTSSYGTEYAQSLKYCYDLLNDTRTDGHKQFCVFMSDGIPNVYQGMRTLYKDTSTIGRLFTGDSNNTRSSEYEYEYYSTLMKNKGVTVFSVGLGLYNTNSAWSGASKEACNNVGCMLLNDISGPAGETTNDTGSTLSKKDTYFFDIADKDAATEMKNVFSNIAKKILEAATNVVVQDKIADEYTMVFDIPTGTNEIDGLKSQEFYIEVKEYTLDDEHDRTSTYNSLAKIYLGTDNNTYYAASDASGTKYADPVFTGVEDGKKGYYSIVDSSYVAKAGEIVINVNETSYKFIADGTGTHNMTSGAYANGTIDSETNMSTDLVIVTPYFCYSAATRMLAWTAEKLTTTELALSYFLYLDNSATEVGTGNEVPAATYPTNDYAYLTYTNYLGNECQQKFPEPQMTWNGAQVSYVFYLVNEFGQPVNRAGKVVPFAEAVYVTDVYTYAVTWNDDEGTKSLDAAYLAKNLVPDVYALYDSDAEYEIHVYQTNDGININDYFIIEGSESVENKETTKVFNTKAGDKYSTYGAYSATAGTYKDADKQKYYEVSKENAEGMQGFDFANTTVAFAVVWKPELVDDVVVIDYGLPVVINVNANDSLASGVVGVRTDAPANVDKNSGTYTSTGTKNIKLDYGSATVENMTSVRYTPNKMTFDKPEVFYYESDVNYYNKGTLVTTSMYSSVTIVPATTIYYEDTNVFVTYEDGTFDASRTNGKWSVDGTENTSATQDTDRPGESKISASLDADNIYGYDSAYLTSSRYSLGSAHKVTVSSMSNTEGSWPTSTFTFTGTAFDIISLTSNTTGTITVDVVNNDIGYNKTWFVDTYYGYTFKEAEGYLKYTFSFGTDGKWHMIGTEVVDSMETTESTVVPAEPKTGDTFVTFEKNGTWEVTDSAADNALYQIPVIKSPELTYGTYTVKITPRYANAFNHQGDDSYDFYLDAIRIYNPADDGVIENTDGTVDTTINDAYVDDNEAYPEYIEIRTSLLGQNAFDTTEDDVTGAVFIDGFGTEGDISDYSEYGPNNEVYLQKGQAVAFKLSNFAYTTIAASHIGVKAPTGGDASLKVTALDGKSQTITTSSATELYFDISECVEWNSDNTSKVLVIENTSEAMVSLTNLKFTYKGSSETATALMMSSEDAAEAISYMSFRYLASVPTEEVFVPETLEVQVNETSVRANEYVTVKITTSEDVEKVTVNGEEVTSSKTDQSTGLTTWTYYVKATAKGTLDLEVTAYNNNGLACTPVVTTVEVTASIEEQLKNLLGSFWEWLYS